MFTAHEWLMAECTRELPAVEPKDGRIIENLIFIGMHAASGQLKREKLPLSEKRECMFAADQYLITADVACSWHLSRKKQLPGVCDLLCSRLGSGCVVWFPAQKTPRGYWRSCTRCCWSFHEAFCVGVCSSYGSCMWTPSVLICVLYKVY